MVGAFIGIIAVLLATTPEKRRPPMKICWLGRFIIVKAIYKLARKSLPRQRKRRGPKRYAAASKIAVLAWGSPQQPEL